jgi:putative SOS response-associated peptidase YedK
MCRDNTLFYDLQEIYSYYEIPDLPELDFEPIFHEVAAGPTKWPIVTAKGGERKVIAALWGFIPFYAKMRKEADQLRVKMVNARQETILTNNTFKNALAKRRCIVPSTGFFEHHHEIGGKRKMPYFIKNKQERLFSMAGIYTDWVDKETGEVLTSFAIITTSANDLMAKIHNGGDNPERMPLMIRRDQAMKWLDPATDENSIKEILGYKIPAEELTAHAVFTVRGKNKLVGPEIIEPYEWDGYRLELGCN